MNERWHIECLFYCIYSLLYNDVMSDCDYLELQ